MKNVILSHPCRFLQKMTDHMQDLYQDAEVTSNFEQVLAMVKLGEVSRICILMGGINYSGSESNTISGQMAAEKIHSINPSIPILVWNGRSLRWKSDTREYEYPPARFENELYLDSRDYEGDKFFEVTEEFLGFDKGMHPSKELTNFI